MQIYLIQYCECAITFYQNSDSKFFIILKCYKKTSIL